MIKNNFKRAPEGQPNVELVCFYDTDKSRWEFEGNFKILQYSHGSRHCIAYYIDNGNVPDDSEISFTLSGAREEKREALMKEGYDDEDMPEDGALDDEILFLYGQRLEILSYQDFNDVFSPVQAVPSKTLACLSVQGYSQGDYAEVFYSPEDLEKAWGKAPDEKELQKLFNRLFYGAPIFCRFIINETEYDYSELMPDDCVWDREKFAEIVAKKSGLDQEFLKDFLPEYPDYPR